MYNKQLDYVKVTVFARNIYRGLTKDIFRINKVWWILSFDSPSRRRAWLLLEKLK